MNAARTELPPGPRYPTGLSTLGWLSRPLPYLRRCQRRYGDVFTLRVVHEPPWIVLASPDDVRRVFRGRPEHYHAGEANNILRPLLGSNSLLLLDEREHLRQRKLLLPPFHGERVKRWEQLMRDSAAREVATWPRGRPIQTWPRMQTITFDVIMRAVFGVGGDGDGDGDLAPVRKVIGDALEWTSDPRRFDLLAIPGPNSELTRRIYRWAVRGADELLLEEIARRRADGSFAERDDVMSLLLGARDEDGRPMNDEEVRDELMTLLVAGHETTATELAWAIATLVQRPHMLERIRIEAQAGGDDYLDGVVKETLRLRPVFPVCLRRLTEPTEVGGYLLPAGTNVIPCIYLVNRNAEVYPDPHAFVPERWQDRQPGAYNWIPFGGGVRRCIGSSFAILEMKAVLAAIATTVRLRPPPDGPERTTRRSLALAPARGGEVVVESLDAPRRHSDADARPAPVSGG